jgi:hypothetical protein
VLLGAFVITGRGLGASGAFASAGTAAVNSFSPATATTNPYFSRYLSDDGAARPWRDWLVIEIAGLMLGGFISARLARRSRFAIERGAGVTAFRRLLAATGGGFAMGVGAVLARGCTSGQALTGGALLSVGSWTFIVCAFAAAYAGAWPLRRLWR